MASSMSGCQVPTSSPLRSRRVGPRAWVRHGPGWDVGRRPLAALALKLTKATTFRPHDPAPGRRRPVSWRVRCGRCREFDIYRSVGDVLSLAGLEAPIHCRADAALDHLLAVRLIGSLVIHLFEHCLVVI
jgi:hypothetical protein